MASEGDGKKRRSLLPAPKKPAGLPLAASQAPFSDEQHQPHPSILPVVSAVYSSDTPPVPPFFSKVATFSAARDHATVQHKTPRPAERMRMDRHIKEYSFGIGLHVGARVRIGGIKPGVLRYLGTTHMAPGIFCGVELLDPDGNHDGEVSGHRYFTCAPNHGIFAPKEKVCLDTLGVLGRLESDLDVNYSSSDSLSERAHREFRRYDREYFPLDFPKPSQLRPHCAQHTQDVSSVPRSRDLRHSGGVPSQFSLGPERSLELLESHAFSELARKTQMSALLRAGTSILQTQSLQCKLSAFSNIHNRYEYDTSFHQRPPSCSSESEVSVTSSLEALAKNQGSLTDVDSDQEYGRVSPKHRTSGERSLHVSEDDGFVRDIFSTDMKKHLRADSKQYLNFTFDPEELNRSLDSEDNERDTNFKDTDFSTVHGGAVNKRNSDLLSQNATSDDTFGNHCTALTCQPDKSIRTETRTGKQETDIQPNTTCLTSVCSDSYALLRKQDRRSLDIHAPRSETNKDDLKLSSTHTVLSSDLSQEMRPRADDGGGDSLSAGVYARGDERIIKGGYVNIRSVEEKGCGVKLSYPVDSYHNENCLVSLDQVGDRLNKQLGYTVSTSDLKGSPECSQDRFRRLVTPNDDLLANFDTPGSSPRKMSRRRPNQDGGKSSSSGIQPIISTSDESRGDNLDDGSTGVLSEVSQTLEWDYGHDSYDDIPHMSQESTMSASSSNGISESLSDEENNDFLDEEVFSNLTQNSDQFQTSDNEFENIDNFEDFPVLRKCSGTTLTDSVTCKDFGFYPTKYSHYTVSKNVPDTYPLKEDTFSTGSRIISWDSSQETLVADTPGSVDDKTFMFHAKCTVISTDGIGRLDSAGEGNLNAGYLNYVQDVVVRQDNRLTGEGKRNNNNCYLSSHKDMSSSGESNAVSQSAETYMSLGWRHEENDGKLGSCNRIDRGSSKEKWSLSLLSATSTDTDMGIQEEGNKHDLPTGRVNASQLKADEEDDSSGNAEDERIEADRVYGQNKKTRPAAVGDTFKFDAQDDDDALDGDSRQTDHYVDADMCVDSPSTAVEDDEVTDGNGLTKDESDQSTTRTRKTITITKKRSENVDHKMPNTNVASRLADYIKAPVPVKPKEDREKDQKKKRNKDVKNASQKRMSLTEINNLKLDSRRPSTADKNNTTDDNIYKTKLEKSEKPKPIIKRAPHKSKWDEIMSQIEANKDTAKPKPMSEIKSSLAAYLNTPPPQLLTEETDNNTELRKRESKSKMKQLPPPPPRIDFSKIKSKLNVPTAASAMKAMPKREHSPKVGKADKEASRDNTADVNAEPAAHSASDGNREMAGGSVVLTMQPVTDGAISVKSSHTYVSDRFEAGQQIKEGVTSKGDTLDLNKKNNSRQSAQNLTTDHVEKEKSALDQPNSQKRSTQASSNQPHKPRALSTTKITSHTNNNPRIRVRLTGSAAQKEIERLESLCESRTNEVTHMKIQLTATIQAFDAIAVLLNYSCNELKAFEGPTLVQKLDAAEKQLEFCVSQIADLSTQKEMLDNNLMLTTQEKDRAARQTKDALDSVEKERNEHSRHTHDMNDTHSVALTTQREELSAKYDDTMKKLTQFYERQIELLRQDHERQVANITNEGKMDMNSLKICHLEEIQELRNKHDHQMEELHKQHRNKLDDITLRFEAMKLSLSEKVDSLRKECDDLARRARDSEEALQRDADVKVQIALSPYLNLPSEIESLKSVQEMRLEEIQKLRTKIMDLEKQLEEVPIAREKIISLQQKVDNLEAIINIKTEHEKQLHEKCQVFMYKYERESRANKRISMDFEQVMWRMSQSSEFGSSESLTKRQLSRSSSHNVEGSPESQSHGVHTNGNHGDGILRVRKRSSHSTSNDRKLRSRSATFLTYRNENSDGHSPSLSPQMKQKKRSKKCHSREIADESGDIGRMCHSAGPEILYDILSDTSSQQTQSRYQNETTLLKDFASSQMTSSSDMARSYIRSLSGVSDSGIYDSLVRSDVLNSSMASTDSEWGTSVNLPTACESTVGDNESGPQAGDYPSPNDLTVAEVKGSLL